MPPKRPPPRNADSNRKGSSSRKKVVASLTAAATALDVTLVTRLEDNDVLMGRGALATDFEGNLRLREIVRQRQEEYSRAVKRNRKHQIAEEIIDMVKAKGGRFLQGAETLQGIDPASLPRYEAAWFIVNDVAVLTAKVKQLLRDVKPKTTPTMSQEGFEPADKLQKASTTTGTGTQLPQTSFPPPQTQTSPSLSSTQTTQPIPRQVTTTSHSWTQAFQAPEGSSAQNHQGSQTGTGLQEQVHSRVQQHHAAFALSSSHQLQQNASNILQALSAGNTSQEQQYDILLALSMASRPALAGNSGNAAAAPSPMQNPAPAPSERESDFASLAASILEQNQRRERERALSNALLSQILPQIRPEQVTSSAAPPSASQPLATESSMSWLLDQLRSDQSRGNSASTQREAAPSPPVPPPSAAVNSGPNYAELAASLLGNHAQPRRSGLLESLLGQTSGAVDLERLLPTQERQSQQDARTEGDPVRGLEALLRSLHQQYYPPPS